MILLLVCCEVAPEPSDVIMGPWSVGDLETNSRKGEGAKKCKKWLAGAGWAETERLGGRPGRAGGGLADNVCKMVVCSLERFSMALASGTPAYIVGKGDERTRREEEMETGGRDN